MNEYIFQENPLLRELHVELDGKYVIFESSKVEGGYLVIGFSTPVRGNSPSHIFKKTITGSGKIVPCPSEVQEKIANIFKIKANLIKLLD